LAMAFGTMSADLLESSANRSPEPAVLFHVTGDDRAGEEVERLLMAFTDGDGTVTGSVMWCGDGALLSRRCGSAGTPDESPVRLSQHRRREVGKRDPAWLGGLHEEARDVLFRGSR
jgi:hypothetical protein